MNYRILLCSFIISVSLLSCKEPRICQGERDFCRFVKDRDYQATGPAVNKFLASLRDNDENSLEKLRAWLLCKSCVEDTEIICNSCIRTLPVQSEIRVIFKVGKERVTQIMDISMSEPLKFGRFHD